MSLSSALARMALNILAKEGQTVSLYLASATPGTYDPATGLTTPAIPTILSVKAALLDFAILSSGTQTRTGTIIEKSDKECYLLPSTTSGTALPRAPNTTGDYLITAAGIRYRIENVKEHDPSGSCPIMYTLWLKR